MCNIAGYSGSRQAAPILLEMLRRQQYYDGDMCTGVATIHEGKLHYRKTAGNVDAIINQTDVLSLPGTVGIAHTRPSRDKEGVFVHPFISNDGRVASVTNGTTPKTKYWPRLDASVDMLKKNGFNFVTQIKNVNNISPKLSSNGDHVSPAEARVNLIQYYINNGKTPEEALALTCGNMYSDNVTVTVSEYYPDSILVLRTTRSMTAYSENGESYIATTRFGLPEEIRDKAFDLPLFHVCKINGTGITVTGSVMDAEPVSDMTPYTYYEGYRRLEALLKSEKAPLYFDELEFAADEMRDLWPGDHTLVQHARLVYDLLYIFDKQGRLRREERVQERPNGTRTRYYMWLED